jgi:SsrA-binding protein
MSAYIENRKIYFNYEIVKKYEGGIELLGLEVKSIRSSKVSLEGAFVIVRGEEVFLINANITPFQVNNTPQEYDPLRNRKILLTQKEILELKQIEKNKNLTIVPISLYNKNRKIKIEIALVKGKKKFDKRETIKKRDTDREIRREVKGR